MKNGLERKQWETPVLEKIKMSATLADCAGGGTAGSFKHKAGSEGDPNSCGSTGS